MRTLQGIPVSPGIAIGETLVIEDVATDKRIKYRDEALNEGVASMIGVPLKSRDEVVGLMRLFSQKKQAFDDDLIMMVEALAHSGAVAIQNASMHLALEKDKESLEKGIIRRPIAIFPEGTRSPTGELQPFRKKGLNILMETGIPLVPMAMKGTRDAMPKGRYTVTPARIRVKIGKPLVPEPGLSDEEKDQIRQRLWEWIHTHLATL